jgi:hypothetical protein
VTPSAARGWEGACVLVLAPTQAQGEGSRRRTFAVCRSLTEAGAQVTFVHYAADAAWSGGFSRKDEIAIAKASWQSFTVAPTRRTRMDSADEGQGIDASWDPAIGTFLDWLFSVRTFDAFVVNHCWLSKAFEFAPASVFGILDVHGELPGSRAMRGDLQATDAEMGIALDRADLVWSVAPEVCAALDGITATRVLKLPHVDFAAAVKPDRDPDGFLRVGLLATNDTDRVDILQFAEVAAPVFGKTFAPAKLMISGPVDNPLDRAPDPFVVFGGIADNDEDFFHSIDCLAIPSETSLGLDVRPAEAIARGVPVLSTATPFEGYTERGATHGFTSFAALAQALSDLAFAPRTELDALATVSRRIQAHTSAIALETLGRTAAAMCERRRMIALAVDSRAFVRGSIFNLALAALHDRLRRVANLVVLVVAGSAKDVVGDPVAIERFHRVLVGQDVAGAEALQSEIESVGAGVIDIGDFLRTAKPRLVIADALGPALLAGSSQAVIVTRTELVALSEGSATFAVPGSNYRRAFASSPAGSLEMAGRLGGSGAEQVLEACLWPTAMDPALVLARRDERVVALLAPPRAPATAVAVHMARSWKLKPIIVHGLGVEAEALAGVSCMRADSLVSAILSGARPVPQFAVDLSDGGIGLPLLRELLERMHVPTVSAAQGHGPDRGTPPLTARTEAELWSALRSFATDPHETQDSNFRAVWGDLDDPPDGTWLARFAARLFEEEGSLPPVTAENRPTAA